MMGNRENYRRGRMISSWIAKTCGGCAKDREDILVLT
jgi:hypothetical protein